MIRNYQVSEYLLQHYVPFADVDGQLVMLRRDLIGKVRPPNSVGVPVVTSDLYFEQSSCDWGYVPNFLQVPAEVGRSRGVSLKVVAAKSEGARRLQDGLSMIKDWCRPKKSWR